MDLRYTDAEQAFRSELRALAGRRPARPPDQALARRLAGAPRLRHPLAAPALRRRLRRGRLAGRGRRPGLLRRRGAHLQRGARAGPRPLRGGQLRRPAPRRARPSSPRAPRAQRQRYLPAHPEGRRGLVPGLLRARRRQRPGLHAHPGRPRRGRLRGHRLEDLDVARRGGRLLRAAGPHRRRGQPPPGHLLADPAHGHPGSRDPAPEHHRRLDRVRRALPRRGPGAGGQPGRGRERRLAGDHGHPQLRAGHRLRRRPARGLRAADLDRGPGPAHRGVGRRRRPVARPATCAPSSTPCGP